MNEFSLLYPQGTAPGFQKISDTACNDLSLDYILSHVAKSEYEKNLIKRMMIGVESDPDVIRYRSDIFEDFINYPSFKDKSRTRSIGLIISKHWDGASMTTRSRRFGS